MKSLYFIAAFALSGIMLFSCRNKPVMSEEAPLARVQNKYLYPGDLKDNLQAGLSPEDSLRLMKRMVEDWVRNQLLLLQAETYLPENEKDVDRQVEEYRASLLIFIYKQYLLMQHIDTVIQEEEIVKYYNDNTSNFILNGDMVKANFLKIPASAPQLANVRKWYMAGDLYLNELSSYCRENSGLCILQSNEWQRFSDLLAQTPLEVSDPGRYLAQHRNIETRDSSYLYFIHINEWVAQGQPSPIEMVKDNIYTVLMNKRKLEYIQNLENTVYKDGLSRKKVEIYQQ